MRVLRYLSLQVIDFSFFASPTWARVVDPPETSALSSIPATKAPILISETLTPRTVETVALPFRSFLSIGFGWNIYYYSWHASILPVQPAAWALTALYAYVSRNARTAWRMNPTRNTIKAVIGPLELLMVCTERPIPWDFVEDFAKELEEITRQGWTGEFYAFFFFLFFLERSWFWGWVLLEFWW